MFQDLRDMINLTITSNNNNEISGQDLRELLANMLVPQLGAMQYKGVASLQTDPGDPSGGAFYMAAENGTYTLFDGLTVQDELAVFVYNHDSDIWTKDQIMIFDGTTSGSVTKSYVDEADALLQEQINQLSGGGNEPKLLHFLSGWQSGLTFQPYAEWSYEGALKTDTREIILDAADPTYDRFDLFIINLSTGQIEVLKGTAAASPTRPEITDPDTQLDTGVFISVKAGATTPDGITGSAIYLENAGSAGGEWDASQYIGPSYDLASTNSPRTGTYCIETTQPVPSSQTAIFEAPGGSVPIADVSEVSVWVKYKAAPADPAMTITMYGTDKNGKSVVEWMTVNKLATTTEYQELRGAKLSNTKVEQVTRIGIRAGNDDVQFHLDDIMHISGATVSEPTGEWEPYLGLPPADGYILQSNADGTRSWVPPSQNTISGITSVTTNHLLTTASNNEILRVKDYASIIIPSGLGLKHRTVIKKATGKTVSLTAGENVILETPSGYLAEVLAQNDAIEIVCEEIIGSTEYWGVYGALATGESLNGYPTAIKANETSVSTSLLWPFIYKSSDFPEVTTTKDYFTIYSTDHDSGDGGIYWGEMDDPEWTNFVERGLIKSGYQAEGPWLIRKAGVAEPLYLFYHTLNEPGNGTGDGSANIQETRLITTAGGELHTATYTDKGRPLGLQADENHTGYLRIWKRGENDYIGHHLLTDGAGGSAGYSTSNDLETWTRAGVIDTTSGMPAGDSYSRFSIIPYTYNGTQYGFIYHINSSNEYFIAIAQLDANLLPNSFIKDITQTDNLYGMTGYIEGDMGYVLFESGAASDNNSVFYLLKYYLPETA